MEKTVMSPCFKYLIRHAAKNEKELHRFAKFFFSLCRTRRISDGDALRQYTSLRVYLVGVTHAVVDILAYGGDVLSPADFREKVMSDPTVESEPSCREYVRDILGDDSVCRLCRHTNGTFSNENVGNEYKVLRYIYESSMNLSAFKDNGNNASFFRGEVDLARELSYDYPVVVPMNRECGYKLISGKSKPAQQFFRLALPVDERLSSLEYGVRMPLLKQDSRVDELCMINPNVIQTAWREFIKNISSCEVISDEEFVQLIGKGSKRRVSKKSAALPSVYDSMVAFVEGLSLDNADGSNSVTDTASEAALVAPSASDTGISDVDTGNTGGISALEEAMQDVRVLQQELSETSAGEESFGMPEGCEPVGVCDDCRQESYSDSDILSDDMDGCYSGADAFSDTDTMEEFAVYWGAPSGDNTLAGLSDDGPSDDVSCDEPVSDSDSSSEPGFEAVDVPSSENLSKEASAGGTVTNDGDTMDSDEEDDDFFHVLKDDDGWGGYEGPVPDDTSDDSGSDGVHDDGENEQDVNADGTFDDGTASDGDCEKCDGQEAESVSPPEDSLTFDELNAPVVMGFDELSFIAEPFKTVPLKDERSKHVALEIVYCDGEYFILLFFMRSKKAFYCRASEVTAIDGDIRKVLSGKRTCLITYQPYYLYSLSRIYGFRVHNLYSIYSVDRLLFPGEKVSGRLSLLKSYAQDKEREWEPLCTETSQLSFMPLYPYIKSRQLMHCEEHVSDASLALMMSFDELMGYSYLNDVTTYEPLFDISEDGRLIYARTVPQAGGDEYVSYATSEGDPDIFLYHCLLRYVDADKLWSSRAYVYSISEDSVVMYMPAATREKTLTQISQLYYDYGLEHRDAGLMLEIS